MRPSIFASMLASVLTVAPLSAAGFGSEYFAIEFDVREWPLSSKGRLHNHHYVDLGSERFLVYDERCRAGYDGREMWITPAADALGVSPRSYTRTALALLTAPLQISAAARQSTVVETPLGRLNVRYESWQEVAEYQLPQRVTIEGRGTFHFDRIQLHREPPAPEMFGKPASAVVSH